MRVASTFPYLQKKKHLQKSYEMFEKSKFQTSQRNLRFFYGREQGMKTFM